MASSSSPPGLVRGEQVEGLDHPSVRVSAATFPALHQQQQAPSNSGVVAAEDNSGPVASASFASNRRMCESLAVDVPLTGATDVPVAFFGAGGDAGNAASISFGGYTGGNDGTLGGDDDAGSVLHSPLAAKGPAFDNVEDDGPPVSTTSPIRRKGSDGRGNSTSSSSSGSSSSTSSSSSSSSCSSSSSGAAQSVRSPQALAQTRAGAQGSCRTSPARTGSTVGRQRQQASYTPPPSGVLVRRGSSRGDLAPTTTQTNVHRNPSPGPAPTTITLGGTTTPTVVGPLSPYDTGAPPASHQHNHHYHSIPTPPSSGQLIDSPQVLANPRGGGDSRGSTRSRGATPQAPPTTTAATAGAPSRGSSRGGAGGGRSPVPLVPQPPPPPIAVSSPSSMHHHHHHQGVRSGAASPKSRGAVAPPPTNGAPNTRQEFVRDWQMQQATGRASPPPPPPPPLPHQHRHHPKKRLVDDLSSEEGSSSGSGSYSTSDSSSNDLSSSSGTETTTSSAVTSSRTCTTSSASTTTRDGPADDLSLYADLVGEAPGEDTSTQDGCSTHELTLRTLLGNVWRGSRNRQRSRRVDRATQAHEHNVQQLVRLLLRERHQYRRAAQLERDYRRSAEENAEKKQKIVDDLIARGLSRGAKGAGAIVNTLYGSPSEADARDRKQRRAERRERRASRRLSTAGSTQCGASTHPPNSPPPAAPQGAKKGKEAVLSNDENGATAKATSSTRRRKRRPRVKETEERRGSTAPASVVVGGVPEGFASTPRHPGALNENKLTSPTTGRVPMPLAREHSNHATPETSAVHRRNQTASPSRQKLSPPTAPVELPSGPIGTPSKSDALLVAPSPTTSDNASFTLESPRVTTHRGGGQHQPTTESVAVEDNEEEEEEEPSDAVCRRLTAGVASVAEKKDATFGASATLPHRTTT